MPIGSGGTSPRQKRLNDKQGRVRVTKRDLPHKFYFYLMANLDGTEFDNPNSITKEDFSYYVASSGSNTTMFITLSPTTEFPQGIVDGKIIADSSNAQELSTNSLDWWQKDSNPQFFTDQVIPDDKRIRVVMLESAVPDSNGLIRTQSVFWISRVQPSYDMAGIVNGSIVTLEKIASESLKNDEGNTVNLVYTIRAIQPINVKKIKIKFDVMPIFSSQSINIIRSDNASLDILPSESFDKLNWHFVTTQLIGTNDYQLECIWTGEYRYLLEVNKSLKNFGYKYNDSGLGPLTTTSDENGKISFFYVGFSKYYYIYNAIPSTEYIYFEPYVLAQYAEQGYLPGAQYKSPTDEFKQLMNIYYAGTNMGLANNNFRESYDVNIAEDSQPEAPWQSNDGFYYHDTIGRLFDGIGGSGSEDELGVWYSKEITLTSQYSLETLRQLKADFFKNGIIFNTVPFDIKLPETIITAPKSSVDPNEWDKANEDDRSYFVLMQLNQEQLSKIIKSNPIQYKEIMAYPKLAGTGSGLQPAYIDVPDKDSIVNNNKLLIQWCSNRNDAISKGIPVDCEYEYEVQSETRLRQLILIYGGGGTWMDITFLDANGNLAKGIDSTGKEVELPTQRIPTVSTAQFGNKLLTKQELFFGI